MSRVSSHVADERAGRPEVDPFARDQPGLLSCDVLPNDRVLYTTAARGSSAVVTELQLAVDDIQVAIERELEAR